MDVPFKTIVIIWFLIENCNYIADLDAFAAIIKRETDKEERDKQNAVIKELDPLIFTLHLGSMKIFFSNIETEEKTVDGEVLGELDQVLKKPWKWCFIKVFSKKKLSLVLCLNDARKFQSCRGMSISINMSQWSKDFSRSKMKMSALWSLINFYFFTLKLHLLNFSGILEWRRGRWGTSLTKLSLH